MKRAIQILICGLALVAVIILTSQPITAAEILTEEYNTEVLNMLNKIYELLEVLVFESIGILGCIVARALFSYLR